VTLEGQTRDPDTLRAQYLKNIWRCYLATVAKVITIDSLCCEAARSSILATAWLLVWLFLLQNLEGSLARRVH